MEARITKLVEISDVYYTVFWSRLQKADRYEIITKVPSVAGIFELYFQDKHKQLNLFHIAKAWYGGLRTALRKATDPELEEDKTKKDILENYDTYYRYTVIPSYADMSDILYFFAATYRPHTHQVVASGRYENIFVNEVSEDKIVTVD
ncbi:MAG: hypothetical protein JSV89_15340 [Spirochaetaceae bacterium]|nr:MAG: hypothetical protein JSV89_15340 [Spirochaetaceae bacterium]